MNTRKVLLLRMPSAVLKKTLHPVHYYPPLTLKYIQAILARESQCNAILLDGWADMLTSKEVLHKISTYGPDIMVIMSNFIKLDYVLSFLNESKRRVRDLFIIVIGPDATWNKKQFMSSGSPVDVCISGDAERETGELIRKLLSGEMDRTRARTVYRDMFKGEDSLAILEDPDSLPFPEFSREEMLKYSFIYPVKLNQKVYCGYIKTSWGCPHTCIFCSQTVRKSYGNRVRQRSAKRVVDEIEYLMGQGANFISFEDDDFTFSREHITSLCRQITQRDLHIRWSAQTRIDEVDAGLLKVMSEAGCDFLQIGIETGSERILRVLKKTKNPEQWIPRSKEIFHKAREFGIATCALFMIGSPTETVEDVQASMRLTKALRPDLLKIHFFHPYPGSEIYNMQMGGARDQRLESVFHHDRPSELNLSTIDISMLIRLRKQFYAKMYLNPLFIIRHLATYSSYYYHNFRNLKYLTVKLLQLLLM